MQSEWFGCTELKNGSYSSTSCKNQQRTFWEWFWKIQERFFLLLLHLASIWNIYTYFIFLYIPSGGWATILCSFVVVQNNFVYDSSKFKGLRDLVTVLETRPMTTTLQGEWQEEKNPDGDDLVRVRWNDKIQIHPLDFPRSSRMSSCGNLHIHWFFMIICISNYKLGYKEDFL